MWTGYWPIGDTPPLLLSSDVQPIGGDTELIANAEYRVPLMSRLSAAAFFDIGAVFQRSRLKEQQFISPVQTTPPVAEHLSDNGWCARWETSRDQIPNYRISLGVELRVMVPVVNLPCASSSLTTRTLKSTRPRRRCSRPKKDLLLESVLAVRCNFSH